MGDKIELLTAKGTDIYTVDRILITDPSDVSVLDSGTKPALTLVTCYPFHYIGPAPRRFIVEASLQQ
jgi:sortase A